MVAILVLLLVVGTSIWVGVDASHRDWSGDGFIKSPAGWVIGSLVFWVGVFPMYLWARKKTPRASSVVK